MMIDMDDPDHLRRRKLVNRGYTPRRVRDREAEVRATCDAIIDRIVGQDTCDFVWDIAAPLPLAMIANDLGMDESDRPQLLGVERRHDARPHRRPRCRREGWRSVRRVHGRTRLMSSPTARENPRDDLMSVLCHAEVDGEQPRRRAIIHESLLILIGGDETTRHVISGGAYQLLVDRSRWDGSAPIRACSATAVEEMLRWVSPIKNMARTATRDVELGGQTIAEGDKLLLLYPSANRDEEMFTNPFDFDIARTPNEHVAFGFGTHFCLGNSLARLELQVMFEQLFRACPTSNWSPTPSPTTGPPTSSPATNRCRFASAPSSNHS